jgi:hypothetical protein
MPKSSCYYRITACEFHCISILKSDKLRFPLSLCAVFIILTQFIQFLLGNKLYPNMVHHKPSCFTLMPLDKPMKSIINIIYVFYGCLLINIPVEVFYAVYLICCIYSEWNTIQTLPTNNTREALRVIRLPSGPENSIQDWLHAYRTLLQGVL